MQIFNVENNMPLTGFEGKGTAFSRRIFPQNGRKLESVENKIRDIFI